MDSGNRRGRGQDNGLPVEEALLLFISTRTSSALPYCSFGSSSRSLSRSEIRVIHRDAFDFSPRFRLLVDLKVRCRGFPSDLYGSLCLRSFGRSRSACGSQRCNLAFLRCDSS
ncbi:hypothetical protein MA16_Dca029097 [Dendrobium catenatum]|uniref:Uncharacterized protein n=1 Tax=Dendrobium catenatum TaxID=906689 RepID=A0A2I0VD90_9ASPA|nr:hypothetical protein MA16_Dca029097 [Dendrobium catenatum]